MYTIKRAIKPKLETRPTKYRINGRPDDLLYTRNDLQPVDRGIEKIPEEFTEKKAERDKPEPREKREVTKIKSTESRVKAKAAKPTPKKRAFPPEPKGKDVVVGRRIERVWDFKGTRRTYKAYVKESRGKDKWLVVYPNWEDSSDNSEVLTTEEVELYRVKRKRRK